MRRILLFTLVVAGIGLAALAIGGRDDFSRGYAEGFRDGAVETAQTTGAVPQGGTVNVIAPEPDRYDRTRGTGFFPFLFFPLAFFFFAGKWRWYAAHHGRAPMGASRGRWDQPRHRGSRSGPPTDDVGDSWM